MKITIKWLKENRACDEGQKWFVAQNKRDGKAVIESLIKENKLRWANWTIVRLMDKPNRVRYAMFAAEQVIVLSEKKSPTDKRPRKAIEAAKAWIATPTEENRGGAAAYASMKIKMLKYGLMLLIKEDKKRSVNDRQ